MKLCLKPVVKRGKFASITPAKCHSKAGHEGRCSEFPFLEDLRGHSRRVSEKIKRDACNTTGAAWSSEDAGPNRILRWVMLLSDSELLSFGLNMSILKPGVVAKLREKAATYDDCIKVARKLTWAVYCMEGAPSSNIETRKYLESFYGEIVNGKTTCIVCREKISYDLFSFAVRGKAEIETAHANPREHNEDNVGFAHRECNIAQGNKTLEEFYNWISGILERVG